MKNAFVSLLVAVATLFSGCVTQATSSAGYAVHGQVIDVNTKQPIPNVWVVQTWEEWQEAIPAMWSSAKWLPCKAVQLTQADSQGRFRFERPVEFPPALSTARVLATHRVRIASHEPIGDPDEPTYIDDRFWIDKKVTLFMKKVEPREKALERFPDLRSNLCSYIQHRTIAAVGEIAPIYQPMLDGAFQSLVDMKVTPEELADAYVRRYERTRSTSGATKPFTRETFMTNVSDPTKLKRLYEALEKKK